MFNLIQFNKQNNRIIYDKKGINYLSNIKKPLTVISILGESRMGKSTLLNIIVSKLLNIDIKIFNTGNNLKEQGTFGIDMYHCNDYLFLDCQGINYQDSTNDVKILLLAYMLSNLLIMNVNMINNTALKLLEPILLFRNYMTIEDTASSNQEKPALYFRAKDYSFDDDIDIPLKETLQQHDDQYNSIRKTLEILFDDITAIKTDIINRKQLDLLKSGNYLEFINQESSFDDCINKIVSFNSKKIINKDYADYIVKLCKNINNNNKLDNNSLDTIKLINDREINMFLNNIDNSNRQKFEPDGTQNFIDTIVKQRQINLKSIFDNFNNKFKKIDNDTKQYYSNIITETYGNPIKDAIQENYKTALQKTTEYKAEFDQIISGQLETFFGGNRICNIFGVYLSGLKTLYQKLPEKIIPDNFDIFNPVPLYNTEFNQIFEQFSIDFNKILDNFMSKITDYDKQAIEFYNNDINKIKQYINTKITSIMNKSYNKLTYFINNIADKLNIILYVQLQNYKVYGQYIDPSKYYLDQKFHEFTQKELDDYFNNHSYDQYYVEIKYENSMITIDDKKVANIPISHNISVAVKLYEEIIEKLELAIQPKGKIEKVDNKTEPKQIKIVNPSSPKNAVELACPKAVGRFRGPKARSGAQKIIGNEYEYKRTIKLEAEKKEAEKLEAEKLLAKQIRLNQNIIKNNVFNNILNITKEVCRLLLADSLENNIYMGNHTFYKKISFVEHFNKQKVIKISELLKSGIPYIEIKNIIVMNHDVEFIDVEILNSLAHTPGLYYCFGDKDKLNGIFLKSEFVEKFKENIERRIPTMTYEKFEKFFGKTDKNTVFIRNDTDNKDHVIISKYLDIKLVEAIYGELI